jgi:hypothetical protein
MQENYKDLRIGNWVIFRPEGNYCSIESFDSQILLKGVLKMHNTTKEQLDKIEITEDKLQVCGFQVQYPLIIKKTSNEIVVKLRFVANRNYKLYKDEDDFCEVRYIHELQNVFKDITGELLEVNLYGVQER